MKGTNAKIICCAKSGENMVLEKDYAFFKRNLFLTCVTRHCIAKHRARMGICYSLFLYEHDDVALKTIQKPQHWDTS